MWDECLVLHRKAPVMEQQCLCRSQFYRAVTWQIKSPGLACAPAAPADSARGGTGDQQSAPFSYGHIRKTKTNGRNPPMSSLTITFKVQLIGLKRGAAFAIWDVPGNLQWPLCLLIQKGRGFFKVLCYTFTRHIKFV